MAFTLMVRSMRLSLEAIDRQLEAAALILGASRLCVFLTISLPLMTSGIMRFGIRSCVRRVWPDNDLCFNVPETRHS